jgi:hypothetical protein
MPAGEANKPGTTPPPAHQKDTAEDPVNLEADQRARRHRVQHLADRFDRSRIGTPTITGTKIAPAPAAAARTKAPLIAPLQMTASHSVYGTTMALYGEPPARRELGPFEGEPHPRERLQCGSRDESPRSARRLACSPGTQQFSTIQNAVGGTSQIKIRQHPALGGSRRGVGRRCRAAKCLSEEIDHLAH